MSLSCLAPCFTKEAAAASVLIVKGAFVVVVKKSKIRTDTGLSKNHLGIVYACDAGNLHFSCLFFRKL